MSVKVMNRNSKGFSLFETLLTVFIFAAILLVAYLTLRDYAEDTLAQRTAAYYGEIHQALDEILRNPDYFTDIYSAVTDPSNAPNYNVEISLAELINGTGPNINVAANNLNANFNTLSPLRTGFTIILRAPDISADPPVLEIIIAANERIDDRRTLAAASKAEGYGGFFRGSDSRETSGTPPVQHVESAYALWDFPITNLTGTSWFTTVSANPPSFANGTYLVYYDHYNFADLTGDYLYREDVGSDELNTMYAPLNMGNNNLQGTDNIDSQAMILTGRAAVNGSMDVDGAAGVSIDNGNFIAKRRLVAQNATINGVGTGSRGNFSVQGELTVTDSEIRDSLTAITGTMQGGLTVTDGNYIVSDGLNVNLGGTTTVNGTTFIDNMESSSGGRPTLDVSGGQVNTSNISVDRYVQQNADTAVLDMEVNGNTSISNNLTSPIVTVDTLNTNTFGACDRGC